MLESLANMHKLKSKNDDRITQLRQMFHYESRTE
jgi:hypothetical protein